jgi:hypothetical protein
MEAVHRMAQRPFGSFFPSAASNLHKYFQAAFHNPNRS